MIKALHPPRRMLSGIALGILISGASLVSSHAQLIPIQSVSTTGTLGASGTTAIGIANLTDGNFTVDSYQEWRGTGSATLDLGSVRSVDRLVVAMRPVGELDVLSHGYVEVSTDGTNWTRVKDFLNTGAVSSGNVLALGFHVQQARYVRLTMDTPDLDVQIGELRVYNGGGPRVSLLSRGSDESWSKSNEVYNPPRTPFNLVDQDPNSFVLFSSGPPGELLLRLDSVEYDHGWTGISLAIRGHSNGPNNPGMINVFVGNEFGNWTQIFSETFEGVYSNQDLLLEMDGVRHEQYIRIAFENGALVPPNLQFREVDVLPIPEPGSIALGATGLAMLALLRQRRKQG